MALIIAWIITILSAFAAFLTFFQQGKAYGKNTWWYTNKIWLTIVFVIIFIACLGYLKN